MSAVRQVNNRYFAAWNETDPGRRRALIAQTWTPDGSDLDSFMAGDGFDGIAAIIRRVEDQFPGYAKRRTGELDAHHDRVPVAWELATDGGIPAAHGLDVGVLAAGRLQAITSFVDFASTPNGA